MCSMEHCDHNTCRQASVSANPRVPAAVSQGAALAVCPPCPAQRPEQRCASRASARTDVVQLSNRSAVGAFRLTCMPCVSSHLHFFSSSIHCCHCVRIIDKAHVFLLYVLSYCYHCIPCFSNLLRKHVLLEQPHVFEYAHAARMDRGKL